MSPVNLFSTQEPQGSFCTANLIMSSCFKLLNDFPLHARLRQKCLNLLDQPKCPGPCLSLWPVTHSFCSESTGPLPCASPCSLLPPGLCTCCSLYGMLPSVLHLVTPTLPSVTSLIITSSGKPSLVAQVPYFMLSELFVLLLQDFYHSCSFILLMVSFD